MKAEYSGPYRDQNTGNWGARLDLCVTVSTVLRNAEWLYDLVVVPPSTERQKCL
jgi:hypothetical protein